MLEGNYDGSWTYGHCETCMKNAHEEVRMLKESVGGEQMWVCPQCGSSKKL